ncbi:hypothetical protein [Sphingomonas sp.]|jgi:hypothetical protein|uniref:hypothetical protein n=1 Tax=Sphingomonas sp. TaxID=28214 RepID=UPI002EDAE61C
MSAFEYFFGFFGLVLGLSVTEVVTGFSQAIQRRKHVAVGVLTPLMALFVLVDLASFWNNLWQWMQTVSISLGLLLTGIAVAAIYYLAASLLVPRDLNAWPSLDEYFFAHKRWISLGVLVANLVAGFGFTAFVSTPQEYWAAVCSAGTILKTGYFSTVLLALAFCRGRAVSIALIMLAFANYLF